MNSDNLLNSIPPSVTSKRSWKSTLELLKNTFTVVGKDEDIKKPTIHMIVLGLIKTTVLFGSILCFILERADLGAIGVLVLLFILNPYSVWFNVRKKAQQTWIVYNTIIGNDIGLPEATAQLKKRSGTYFGIAVTEMVVRYVHSTRGRKKGFVGFFLDLLFAFLAEVWDLIQHYLLPAVVIENKKVKEAVQDLKHLKDHVPATLVGVFGLDFAGAAIGSVLASFDLLIIIVSLLLAFLIGLVTDAATVFVFDSITLFWPVIFFGVYLCAMLGSITGKIVHSAKAIYFTIFYTLIQKPTSIRPDMKDMLSNFVQKNAKKK